MKEVIFVHAVDAEGPLYESVEAKFGRIEDLLKIKIKKKTSENLKKILNGKSNLSSKDTKKIQLMFSGHLTNYNDNWKKINTMMNEINSKKFRTQLVDSYNAPYKFTWHCLDHVNYKSNPRKRDLGHHKIFDYYKNQIKKNQSFNDDIQWHFHPMSTYREAHRCATSYFRSNEVYEILCRKIIDRNFFPSSFRAGFQAERPDSNWFLEQFIPFDITNMSIKNNSLLDKFVDFKNGRSGNWRNAPSDWSIYHPSHDDYQIPGQCRRWIGRALNVLNRIASIDQFEMDKAFDKANRENSRVLVAVATHDFRNLAYEARFLYKLIQNSSKKFKFVKFRFLTTTKAFQKVIWGNKKVVKNFKINIKFNKNPKKDYPNILIKTKSSEIFGPQPFLAIKTKSKRYIYDNLDFINSNTWGYAFFSDTLPLCDVDTIGIAANDKFGNTAVKVLKL